MISLNTNMTSLMVQKNLEKATRGLNTAIEQMTTGYKLNHSKDNPANYAMMKNMETKLNAWNIASDNISIGYDMLQTADSNAELIGNHLTRIRDLCQQAANGTYGEQSVNAIKSEILARKDEISRIMENAKFNDIKLFSSSASNVNIQVGITGSESSRISVNTSFNLDNLDEIENWDITDAGCLGEIDNMINEVSSYQVRIGASQNRLECALDLAEVNITNLTSSISTIKDADIAKVSSDFIRYQILQQACITLLSTANQMPAMALQLI